METRRNSSPRDDGGTVKIRAASLQEAYRQVRREYGGDAVILGSRSVAQRRGLGIARDRSVEVTVQVDGERPAPADDTSALLHEVDRIEQLVQVVAEQQARRQAAGDEMRDLPAAAALLDTGTSADTVRHLVTRYRGETGSDRVRWTDFLSWLENVLPASNSTWEEFTGCHAFLGPDGCGRTDLVLAAAARLQEAGKHVLVLAVTPTHSGEVRRLQTAAATGRFDAAVIQQAERLEAVADQLAGYDTVLVDLPGLGQAAMAVGGELHTWLAASDAFHRHFALPLDGDARDLAALAATARDWNCDWTAVTRTDASRHWGKLLDLDRSFGLPWSLHRGRDRLEVASSPRLIERILGGSAVGFESATAESWPTGEGRE